MNASSIRTKCENYFHIEKPKSITQGFALGAKIASYVTGITPLIVGIAFGISSLRLWYVQRNISVNPSENSTTQKTRSISSQSLPDSAQSKDELSPEQLAANEAEAHYAGVEMPAIQALVQILGDGSGFTDEELQNYALISKGLSEKVAEIKKARSTSTIAVISEIIHCAEKFDGEIQRITGRPLLGRNGISRAVQPGSYRMFKFDVARWNAIQNDLRENGTKYSTNKLDKLVEDCQLDLVEALAEYNAIPNPHPNPPAERPITLIEPERMMDGLRENEKTRLFEVLELAKETLKGDVFGGTVGYVPLRIDILFGPEDKMIETDDLGRVHGGLYMYSDIKSAECNNWRNLHYQRPPGLRLGSAIHWDWWIGKRQGDRIVIPSQKDDSEDRQVILRLNFPRTPKAGEVGAFEYRLIYGIKFMLTQDRYLRGYDEGFGQELSRRLVEAYGQELVDSVKVE